jgi:LysR family nitrogen assimilation transcriptional regulator
MINFRPLENFVTVVELGSLSRAARAIHIAQPALSTQIAALENELEVTLLDRSPRGVRPTEAGTILCRHARALLHHMRETQELLKARHHSPSGTVSIGVPMSLLEVFAIPLIKHLRKQYPNLTPYIQAHSSLHLRELVMSGRLDLAVILCGPEHKGLKSRLLATEELYFVTRADKSRSARKTPISLPEVAQHPLVLSAAPYTGTTMLQGAAARAGVTLNVVAEINTSAALLATVEAGLGATMIAMSAVPRHSPLHRFEFRRFIPSITHPISLCLAEDLPPTTAARLTAEAIPWLISELANNGKWPSITLAR